MQATPTKQILVPPRGSFQNLGRSLLSLLSESPPWGRRRGQKHPEFGLNLSLKITKRFERQWLPNFVRRWYVIQNCRGFLGHISGRIRTLQHP